MMLFSILVGLIGLASFTKALAVKGDSAISPDYSLYATYTVVNTNISFELHGLGYTGQPSVVILDLSNFHEKYFPVHHTPMNETSGLRERDICTFLSGCAQFAADLATTAALYLANTGPATAQALYAASWNFWTANDYANTKEVLSNAITGFVVNIVSVPIGNAMLNTQSAVVPGNDGCSVSDTAKTANYFASSLYDFCTAIQAAKGLNTNTDFYEGEFSTTDGVVEDGSVAVTRNFIASQSGNFRPTCLALGISWKRSIFERSTKYLGLGAK